MSNATKVSDAEATVKFAIFDAIVSLCHKKNDQDFANEVRNAIFDKIFEPHLRWALEEHLEELKKQHHEQRAR